MNGINKKILLAGFVALFAFVVTIGSTYAWFTINRVASVQSMTVNVQTQGSLLILVDDPTANSNTGYNLVDNDSFLHNTTNYKTTITNDDLTAYALDSLELAPVTSADGAIFTNRQGAGAPSSSYVTINFWLISQAVDADVALRDYSISATTGTFRDEVVDAVRLSVDSTDDAVKIYGLNKDYDYDDGGTVIDSGTETSLIALHGLYYTTGTPVSGESTGTLTSASTAFHLTADTPEKVSVRIWVEGWDAECTNNLVAAVFSVAFKFNIIL